MGLICTTAPVLRPLFKGVFQGSSGDNGYQLENSSKLTGKSENLGMNSQGGYSTRIFSASKSKQSKAMTSSNESEEHIVPSLGAGHVIKNVEYRVDYSTA
jgi:hypothetical protein